MDRLPWDTTRKVLLAVAGGGFNDYEYRDCVRVFVAAGFDVETCSSRTGWIAGSFGMRVECRLAYGDVRCADYVAVAFIGGDGAAAMAADGNAVALARAAESRGLVVGAICAATLVPARAGLLDMRRACCHASCRSELVSLGVVLCDEPVVVSGWLVTASGPSYAGPFAEKIIAMIAQRPLPLTVP